MSGKHNTIIAARAKVELEALGFRRQGQSRLWLADHQSWLNVIEFTPDRWSKGTSLMNGAHWLWAGTGFLAFNEAIQSRSHSEFATDEQFAAAVAGIVREAADKAAGIRDKFSSFERIAEFAVGRALSSPDRMQPSWWGYEAGIASALVDKMEDADCFLRGITDERVLIHSAPLLPLIARPDQFRLRVNELVTRQRKALNLSTLECLPF